MNISNNLGIYQMFNTMAQGTMAIHTNRLTRSLYTDNKAGGQGSLLDNDGMKYVNSLRTSADSLSSVVSQLSGTSSANRIVAMSSNTDVVSIQHTGSKPAGVHTMSVAVSQVASGQLNEGNRMEAAAAYEGSTGVNQFSVEVAGKTTQLSVSVREGDTNRDVQQRMADTINNSNTGLRATVEVDTETNASMLRIESTITGSNPNNGFTLNDVNGDLVARTGAADTSRQGQDAIYRVNDGPERRSQTNTVYIGSGVTATFNKASDEAAKITWGREANVTRENVQDMVKSYNDLYSAAAERTNDIRAQSLASRMASISKTYSKSLSDIGIGFDTSGRMTIDSKKMDEAASSGKLDQFFTENRDRNFGFTSQISRLADSVSRNPGNFVSSSQFRNDLMGNSGYSSFGRPTQFNFFSPGSILDFMF